MYLSVSELFGNKITKVIVRQHFAFLVQKKDKKNFNILSISEILRTFQVYLSAVSLALKEIPFFFNYLILPPSGRGVQWHICSKLPNLLILFVPFCASGGN